MVGSLVMWVFILIPYKYWNSSVWFLFGFVTFN